MRTKKGNDILPIVASLILLLALVHLFTGEQTRPPRDPVVAEFNVSNLPAAQALLNLSRNGHVPLGIILKDDILCSKMVTYSSGPAPASAIAKGILGSIPAYTVGLDPQFAVLVARPQVETSSERKLLQLVDPSFGPLKGNLQTLAVSLWIHIRAIIFPDKGTAGSILGSSNDAILNIDMKNASVEQILDRIAVVSDAAWVLRPLPVALTDLEGEMPYTFYPAQRQPGVVSSSFCAPVAK